MSYSRPAALLIGAIGTVLAVMALCALLSSPPPTSTPAAPGLQLDAAATTAQLDPQGHNWLACGLTTTATPCVGGDPYSSWMSFVKLKTNGSITLVTANWEVPKKPARKGASDPSWWYGLQTADGLGALLQPVLLWNDHEYGADGRYEIFNAVMDWSQNCSWNTQGNTVVQPGDVIKSSIRTTGTSRDYVLSIGSNRDTPQTMHYRLSQTSPETVLYFVMEHQASQCDQYPSDGALAFSDVYVD